MENLILYGKTIAFLATDGFEQIELTEPWKAIKNAGGTVKLVAPKIEGTIRGFHHDVPGDEFLVDVLVSNANMEDYDALVLPGGVFSPDAMRLDAESVKFVRYFFDAHKPVAAICHGPWLLIEADVVDARRLTSWPSLRTDIINAGGIWLNEECVCDRGLITSRSPDDLPKFCEMAIKEFAKGVPAVQPVTSDSDA
ncbi:type 1 glutamine amidotransferase domain-containing protein [Pirellulaceae bacterium SH449]